MFAEALTCLPSQPTSVEEHHARQERLAAQFRQDDLLVLASPPHAVLFHDVGTRTARQATSST